MLYIVIIFLVILFDQISKLLVVKKLVPIHTYPLIKDIFHLTYTENTGAAFSILRDKKIVLFLLSGVGILCIIFYLFTLLKKPGLSLLKFSLAIIIAGGLGNLIDRIRLGYVVDFFDFRLINFAIFNIADIFIVVGTALIIIDTLFGSKTLQK